ncbi:aquaporin [Kineococcus aurantiacus]|uniref:MIP family channel proteins n=1 Tax=Kineococcus aurantiacus TaxID=37633 RepID=A0A7Y9AR89_9ACTN|nr:MIP family channel proteins [Kineococcus aurantiacus]
MASGSRGLFGSQAGENVARAGAAELVGTFVLVLAGGATSVAAATTNPSVYDLFTIVAAFGLALTALVAGLGHVSGCHLNPAVTVGLAVTHRFPWRAVPVYVLAQLAGAVLASLATWAVHSGSGPSVVRASATVPAPGVSSGRAFFIEALITFVLVLVIIAVATDDRAPAAAAPLAVGAALAVCIFIAAPLTGGAVNPARAFGPAVVSGTFSGLWLYLLAPLVGGVVAAVCYDKLLAPAHAPEQAPAE